MDTKFKIGKGFPFFVSLVCFVSFLFDRRANQ